MPFYPMHPFSKQHKYPSYGTPLEFGITTHVDKKTNSEICNVCKAVLGD